MDSDNFENWFNIEFGNSEYCEIEEQQIEIVDLTISDDEAALTNSNPKPIKKEIEDKNIPLKKRKLATVTQCEQNEENLNESEHVQTENYVEENQKKLQFIVDNEENMDDEDNDPTFIPPTEKVIQEEPDLVQKSAEIKRKRFRTLEKRKENNKNKHPMLPACKCSHLKCFEKFSTVQRENIHALYWSLNNEEQKIWVSEKINVVPAKRRLVSSDRRELTRSFYLPLRSEVTSFDINTKVCLEFFQATLGFKKFNSSFIRTALKAKNNNFKKTSQVPVNKKDHELIKNHILSFKPHPSHYRRSHAPNRLYLPPELSITFMYNNFCSDENNPKISYEIYRQNICKLNISFKESQSEICGYCAEMDINNDEESKKKKLEHLNKAKEARDQYNLDALITDNGDTKVYAADMQKVVLLPRIPKVKESFFTPRLIVFNETFAAMQKTSNHYCILWSEATAERKAENISSAFINFFKKLRDTRHIIIWLDNCGGQNKNNIIYSALITFMNCDSTSIESITLKYLVKGHTFMAADGIHGKIEQKMRKEQNIYDFDDFYKAVQASSSRMEPIVLEPPNFIKFKNIIRKRNRLGSDSIPYFFDIVEAKFLKGCKDFLYKTSFTETEYKTTSKAVKEKNNFIKMKDDFNAKPRGISESKKEKILKELVNKMPQNRRNYWVNLPSNKLSEDLLPSI